MSSESLPGRDIPGLMPTVPIFLTTPDRGPEAKSRPASLARLDLHALGLHQVEGEPIPQPLAVVPPVEPGAELEVVVVKGQALMVEVDPGAPTLLPRPRVRIHDTAGARGEIAEAVLVGE